MLKEADVSLPTLIMISEDSEALVCLSGLDEIKEKLEDTLKQAAKPGQFVSSEAACQPASDCRHCPDRYRSHAVQLSSPAFHGTPEKQGA